MLEKKGNVVYCDVNFFLTQCEWNLTPPKHLILFVHFLVYWIAQYKRDNRNYVLNYGIPKYPYDDVFNNNKMYNN